MLRRPSDVSLLMRRLASRPRLLDDDFLPWLTFANAGMMHRGNPYLMDVAIRELPSSNAVVEIGSFCGLSTNLISYLLHKHGRANPVIGVDAWSFEGTGADTIGSSGVPWSEYTDFVAESFRRNVEFFSRHSTPHVVRMTSDEFFAAWSGGVVANDVADVEVRLGGAISFAYVDGNHGYEFVRRDFEGIDAHLEVGGLILFDDSADFGPLGSTQLMKELAAHPRYEVVTKNPNYLVRKVTLS